MTIPIARDAITGHPVEVTAHQRHVLLTAATELWLTPNAAIVLADELRAAAEAVIAEGER